MREIFDQHTCEQWALFSLLLLFWQWLYPFIAEDDGHWHLGLMRSGLEGTETPKTNSWKQGRVAEFGEFVIQVED